MRAEDLIIPIAIAGAILLLLRKPEKSEKQKKQESECCYYRGISDVEKYYFKRVPYYSKYYK
ncbi:MAG: hypothetical protein QW734_03815 [Candidatus Bathyarchaeia archaeon]